MNLEGTQGAANVYSIVPQAPDVSYLTWAFGDDSTTVSIAASGNSSSPAIDARKFRRSDGTFNVILTGTGTGKLTVFGSRDGISNLHNFGDLITGMVVGVGSYILKLDNASMAYFPYLTFVITETGGANGITVKAFVVARGG